MATLVDFLRHHATLVLFVCICLGHLLGGARVGKFRLGGVCGTLLVALVLGQANVVVAPGASQVAFALFIFSLGYLAGPQFVASFRREDVRLIIFPAVGVVVVPALVLGVTVLLDLGPGTAAGLYAGGTSQSAALGTAAEALDHLGLPPGALAAEQANLASAYSLCYLCALIVIVAFSTQVAPALMRADLAADAAAALRELHSAGHADLDDEPSPDLVGRVYRIGQHVPPTVALLQDQPNRSVHLTAVVRGGEVLPRARDLMLQADDLLHVVGPRDALSALPAVLGQEVGMPPSLAGSTQTLDIMVTRRALSRSSSQLRDLLAGNGNVAVVEVQRAGRLRVERGDEIKRGDVLTVFGHTDAVRQAGLELGRPIDRTIHADWAYLGGGIVVGLLIGLLDLRWGPLDMTIGTGGGVLLAGLLFGWFRTRHSTIGAYAPAAANVIKDLGLTIFIGVTGLTGAPRVASMVHDLGAALPLAAVLVSLLPATVSLFLARRVLGLPSPLALGAVVGQACSTPALTLLQQRTGNDTPLITFVTIYAMSSVVLPLLAPLVVSAASALSH